MLKSYKVKGIMQTEVDCPQCNGAGYIMYKKDVVIVVSAPYGSSAEELASLAQEAHYKQVRYDAEWLMPPDELEIEECELSPAEIMRLNGEKSLFDILQDMTV